MFTFIKSSVFERVLPIYLDEDEYAELQQYMSRIQKLAGSSVVLVASRSFDGFGRVWASEAR